MNRFIYILDMEILQFLMGESCFVVVLRTTVNFVIIHIIHAILSVRCLFCLTVAVFSLLLSNAKSIDSERILQVLFCIASSLMRSNVCNNNAKCTSAFCLPECLNACCYWLDLNVLFFSKQQTKKKRLVVNSMMFCVCPEPIRLPLIMSITGYNGKLTQFIVIWFDFIALPFTFRAFLSLFVCC